MKSIQEHFFSLRLVLIPAKHDYDERKNVIKYMEF